MSNRITIAQFCSYYDTDPKFFEELQVYGLMDFEASEAEILIAEEQLQELEKIRFWRYELEINPEGIDVIQQLLKRQRKMVLELNELKRELLLFR